MSPTQIHDHHHHQYHRYAKQENINGNGNGNGSLCPLPLKVSKDSHLIKKSSSSSSSSSASSLGVTGTAKPAQQRHPVIIYTHSPKVIHTHPKDFMSLVQKLTGLSRNEDHHDNNIHHHDQATRPHQPKTTEINIGTGVSGAEEDSKKVINNDDNESSSVITDENGDGQVNSCFVPPLFDPPVPATFLPSIPVFTPNSADFLCMNHHGQPFYNYTDPLFFTPKPNTRSSISSSSSGLEGINDFRDY